MADEYGERTEAATPRKRQEARRKGQVPRSQDFSSATLLLAGFLLIFFAGGWIVEEMMRLEQGVLSVLGTGRLGLDAGASLGHLVGTTIFSLLVPLLLVLLIVAFAVNVMQVGFLFSAEPLAPNPGRLDPWAGLGRTFSARGGMRLLLGVGKVLVVGAVLYLCLRDLLFSPGSRGAASVLQAPFGQVVDFARRELVGLGAQLSAALLLVALADFAYQRWQYGRDLRMTRREVQDELRMMDGDPQVQDRRRRLRRQLLDQQALHEVRDADVLISSDTATCAVRYDAATMAAPRLVAVGRGPMARRIRERGIEARIPIVEDPRLVARLESATRPGDEVTGDDLRSSLAEVLAYAYQLGPAGARGGRP